MSNNLMEGRWDSYFDSLSVYVYAAGVTFCLCQPKRRGGICPSVPVSGVTLNVGAAGAEPCLRLSVWNIVCVCPCLSACWHRSVCVCVCVPGWVPAAGQKGSQDSATREGGCSWQPSTISSNSFLNFLSESSRKRGKLFDVL